LTQLELTKQIFFAHANDVTCCRIVKVAQTFDKSKVTFAMSDVHDFEHELAEHGVTADSTQPTVIGHDNANQSYVMNEDFS